MRVFFSIIILLLAVIGGYIAFAHFSGGLVPTFGLSIGGEKAKIRLQTRRFLENIKFKNINGQMDLIEESTPEELKKYIEQILQILTNNIDLQSFSIGSIEINSDNKRARVKISLKGVDNSSNTEFEKNNLLFLYFDAEKKSWIVDITP